MGGRKLIIQIPSFNEEASLPLTFAHLPKEVSGFDGVETLLVDDGSTDGTVAVAEGLGLTHILKLPHRGLARTFITGLQHAVSLGAHTIVNFDADNQYCAADIATITSPILAGKTRLVIGERPLHEIQSISPVKQRLHRCGNSILRALTGTKVSDATSGFRAIRNDLVAFLQIQSQYTYTVEMLIDLAMKAEPIDFVPIRVNRPILRPSRLMKSNAEYVLKTAAITAATLLRSKLNRLRFDPTNESTESWIPASVESAGEVR